MYLSGLGILDSHMPEPSSHSTMRVPCFISGAALGPLLAGLISPSGWNNVFYMLMFADACALLVSPPIGPSLWLLTKHCALQPSSARFCGLLQFSGRLDL